MVVLGVVVATVAAFVVSSVYYMVTMRWESSALGDRAIDRGRPGPAKIAAELARTAVLAAGFAWIATVAGMLSLPAGLGLAIVLWVMFPVVLLLGSIAWDKVPVVTAVLHAGDWLVKLILVAVVLGLLH